MSTMTTLDQEAKTTTLNTAVSGKDNNQL